MNDLLFREMVSADGPLSGREIATISPVGGGCIHQAFCLDFTFGDRLFVKAGTASALAMFEVESEGLEALHRHADARVLAVPQPIGSWLLPSGSVLVLPWLKLGSGDQEALGRGLALMHRDSMEASSGCFGWHRDGFIGYGHQPAGWSERWGEAFVDYRLRPQLKGASSWGLNPDDLWPLLAAITVYLDRLEVRPSLVHGDLWGGNAGLLSDGRGTIYDPAVWWADAEVDVAMTQLFGGFTSSFYDAYFAVMQKRSMAEQRVELYNLYHLLNHANLFGGSYERQCRDTIKSLARQLL